MEITIELMGDTTEPIVKELCRKVNATENIVMTASLKENKHFELRITIPQHVTPELLVRLGYIIGTNEMFMWMKRII